MTRTTLALAGSAGKTTDPFYSSKGWIASAAFLFLIVMIGAVLAFTGGSGATSPPMHAPAINTGGSVCGLPVGNTDPVVSPPAGTTWTASGRISAPSVPRVGPGIIDGADRRCYAHSPLGALLAAANYLAMAGLPAGSLTPAQALAHIVPSHTRDVYARQPAPSITPAQVFQIIAFQVDVVDPDNVTVTLAAQVNGGAMGSVAMPMRWYDGDWRVRLLSVQEPYVVTQLLSLEGFISWAAKAPSD